MPRRSPIVGPDRPRR